MKHPIKASLLAMALASLSYTAHAQPTFSGDGWHNPYLLFAADAWNVNGYRIPAITTTVQGTLVAFGDFREVPQFDIGGKPNGQDQIIDMAYTVSYDQGETWTPIKRFDAKGLNADFLQITDPSIVHDPVSGKTFAFGWAANGSLTSSTTQGMIMYTSEDGGASWDKGRDLHNDAVLQGYSRVLQGPGKGIYYNDTIYMAVQSWGQGNNTNPIAGFIFSQDHGATWQQAYPTDVDGTGQRAPHTSESHVFHHKGYVYLAAKSEVASHAQRYVYRTKDNGKTWEEVVEDFFPEGVERCETSTLPLSDDVYLVGYAMSGKFGAPGNNGGGPIQLPPRKDIYLTTNTGKRILIAPGDTMGYTSLDMDEDNIYVLFEGGERYGNMWFQRFDHASKDYANLTQQILDRDEDAEYIQDLMLSDKSYVKGSYGSSDSGIEALRVDENTRVGFFYKESDENSKDLYRTIEYDTKDFTLAGAINSVAFDTDSTFAALQYSDIEYVNGSEAEAISGMLGYQLKLDVMGYADYRLKLLGVVSDYDFTRNNREGLGRTASFQSYSASIDNAVIKSLKPIYDIKVDLALGMRNTLFGHDAFTEEGGNGWNNAELSKLSEYSHKPYATVDVSYDLQASPNLNITLKAGAEANVELADVEDFREEYAVLDVTKRMALPIEDHTGGYAKGYIGADFKFINGATLTLYGSTDSDSENEGMASIGWEF